jgi:hypothetical protein
MTLTIYKSSLNRQQCRHGEKRLVKDTGPYVQRFHEPYRETGVGPQGPAGVGPCVIRAGGKAHESMEEQAKPAKKKFYKRWWFWVIVLVVIVVMDTSKNDTKKEEGIKQKTQTQAAATPKTPEQALEEQVKSVIKDTGSTEVSYKGMEKKLGSSLNF